MGFWENHSAKVFIVLFVLLSALVLFLDAEATVFFGFTFEEEIVFPAVGILFLAFALLVLNKRVFSGKPGLLEEFYEMSFVSKALVLISLFFFTAALVLAVFKDLSLFNLTSRIIAEERFLAVAMLSSVLVFLIVYLREISVD